MKKHKVISVRYYDRDGHEHHYGEPTHPGGQGMSREAACNKARAVSHKNGAYAWVVESSYKISDDGRIVRSKMRTIKGFGPRGA